MVRAGLVRQLAAGIYVYLPLGQRVIDRINAIIREEINRIGGQEITMPVLHPAEIWQQSGRWTEIGEEMFRLKDRNQREMCLGMTHEEVVAWLAAREIRSYRDLPQIWYQIQTKERDEARPRSGLLRTREFLMKDSYTLDADEAGLDRAYNAHKAAYCRIFDRCGLTYSVVESDPGMMGGSGSHEFMAPSAAGEDEVALCGGCGYAANVALARSVPPKPAVPSGEQEEVATHTAQSGEGCAQCGAPLRVERVIEVGNIFKLGTKYSVPLNAVYLDEGGREQSIVMGSYGIGPARIAAASVEQRHDADGIVWPWSIAPLHVHLLPVNVNDRSQVAAAEELYEELSSAGFDVLLDDRDERPGVKFKDADLIGLPIRVTIGTAFVKEGVMEVRPRHSRQDRKVAQRDALAAITELAQELSSASRSAPRTEQP
jgi:prolyl-tRNA synthetase